MRPIIRSRTGKLSVAEREKQPIVLKQPKIMAGAPIGAAKKRFPWKPILRILFFAVLAIILVWLLNSPIFTVRNIKISGNKTVSSESIAAVVPKNRNLWLYPINDTEAKIMKSSPLMADVQIYRGIPDNIKVVVAERVMALNWTSGGKEYVIGLDGRVITGSASSTDIPKVLDTSNLQPQTGAMVVTPGFVQFILSTTKVFSASTGLNIDHFEVGSTTFDVTVVPKAGPKIIMDSSRDPAVQLRAGKPVLDQFKDKIKQYLDLRVPLRAYFQ